MKVFEVYMVKEGLGNESAESLWLQAGKAHENTFLRQSAQVANWRIFAFISLAIAGLAIAGAIYIGSQPKFVPYIVEVDKLGRTVAVRALDNDDVAVDSKIVYAEMFELIENLRTVSTDTAANDDRIEKGFTRLKGAGAEYARVELRKAKPNDVGQTKTVQVQVKVALPVSNSSWQVEWEEHSFNLKGEPIGVEVWKANLKYVLKPSKEERIFRKNSIGLYVTELNWVKVI